MEKIELKIEKRLKYRQYVLIGGGDEVSIDSVENDMKDVVGMRLERVFVEFQKATIVPQIRSAVRMGLFGLKRDGSSLFF